MLKLSKKPKVESIDTKAGSLAYNRLDMQVSQALHMAIELFPNLNYLLVLDHYDDITIFDDDKSPKNVSYYQMKTNEESISINTAISEKWFEKLYKQLERPDWIVKELGLITNCPLKMTVVLKDKADKLHKKETRYLSEYTPFSKFNHQIIEKIKKDIAKSQGISISDVDLSKFVHMRTTLTISKHREIVEHEMSNFLYSRYHQISINSVKTIFASMIELFVKRQGYELLANDASFLEVKKHKGVSKGDLSRIIDVSIELSLPQFNEIERLLNFVNDADRNDAAYQYMMIYSDIQNKNTTFDIVFTKVKNLVSNNPRNNEESVNDYCNRIYTLIRENYLIYSKNYIFVLIASMIINELRQQI